MSTTGVEKLILAILILAALYGFFDPFLLRIKKIALAKGKLNTDRIGDRILRWFREVIFQGTVIAGRPLVGWMHAFVFWAFIVFLLETADLVARMFGSPVGILGNGSFHHVYQTVVALSLIHI